MAILNRKIVIPTKKELIDNATSEIVDIAKELAKLFCGKLKK